MQFHFFHVKLILVLVLAVVLLVEVDCDIVAQEIREKNDWRSKKKTIEEAR